MYKNINIGQWLQYQKTKINSNNDELYKKLSDNLYVKNSLDEYLKNKEKNKDKRKLTWDEWKQLLFEFCDINKYVPISKEIYKNVKIGSWLFDQKKKINVQNDELYKKLSNNQYIKKSLDDYLINKEKNKDKEILKWNDSYEILVDFCNINKRVPTRREIYKNVKIAVWLGTQKGNINGKNDELYIKLSNNQYIKDSLDQYLINKKKLIK